jgi:Protein of unknown function (DUF2690)
VKNNIIKGSAFVLALAVSDVQAAGCYGAGCDGKDPVAMGCASSAITAKSNRYKGPFDDLIVDLRWSGVCGTNWTRIRWESTFYIKDLPSPSAYSVSVIRTTVDPASATRYIGNDGIYYTPMLNGIGRCVRGEGIGSVWGFDSSNYFKKIDVKIVTSTQC